jgi:hypothetical protein
LKWDFGLNLEIKKNWFGKLLWNLGVGNGWVRNWFFNEKLN